jgi:hypothetical protein
MMGFVRSLNEARWPRRFSKSVNVAARWSWFHGLAVGQTGAHLKTALVHLPLLRELLQLRFNNGGKLQDEDVVLGTGQHRFVERLYSYDLQSRSNAGKGGPATVSDGFVFSARRVANLSPVQSGSPGWVLQST